MYSKPTTLKLIIFALCIFVFLNGKPLLAQTSLIGTTSNVISNGTSGYFNPYGSIIAMQPGATQLSNVYKLKGHSGSNPIHTKLIEVNGELYGTTHYGGTFGNGTIFKYNLTTGMCTELYRIDGTINATDGSTGSINPSQGLMLAANGKLYGMLGGGQFGSIYEYDIATNTYTTKYNFNAGNSRNPRGVLVEVAPGRLYGVAHSNILTGDAEIFEYNYLNNTYSTKASFDSVNAFIIGDGSLLKASDGKLYGMGIRNNPGTSGSSVIYEFNAVLDSISVRYTFSSLDGDEPYGSLIEVGSKLYGMTRVGGANNLGTLFEYNLQSSAFTKHHDFDSISGGRPEGDLMLANNGKIYGLTPNGTFLSPAHGGSLFEFNPVNNSLAPLHYFSENFTNYQFSDGYNPLGTLMQATDNKLYGLCQNGGTLSAGTLFNYDLITDTVIKKVNFGIVALDGRRPNTPLAQAANGKLYGFTLYGGIYESTYNGIDLSNGGVLYEYDYINDLYSKKIDINDSSYATFPAMVAAPNGKLYGTHSSGTNMSRVFEYDYSTNIFTYKLQGGYSEMIVGANGKLYGTGVISGSYHVYEYDFTTNNYTVLHTFVNVFPNRGRLVETSPGVFYGIAFTINFSTGYIYQYNANTNVFSIKFTFNSSTGNPYGASELTEAFNGKLYGYTINGGTNNNGTIFEYNTATNTYNTKYNLNALIVAAGSNNTAGNTNGLIQANNGKFYGYYFNGGNNDLGFVFEYDDATTTAIKKFDLDTSAYYPLFSRFIEVNNCPLLSTAPTNITTNDVDNVICQASSITLTASGATLALGATYQWYEGGCGGTVLSSSSVLTITPAPGIHTYFVNVKETCGYTACISVTITVDSSQTWYLDIDGDNYGTGAGISACTSPGTGYSHNLLGTTDCNDNNILIHQTFPFYADGDNDGYGAGSVVNLCVGSAAPAPTGYSLNSLDCNDGSNSIHPGVVDLCNGIDDDCDGTTDEDGLYYLDDDGDGYGNPSITGNGCTPPSGYVLNNLDCNDGDNTVHPGAVEICNNIDDDCNGLVDDNVPTLTVYQDADGDGYVNLNVTQQVSCTFGYYVPPIGYLVLAPADCDDTNGSINSGAKEICGNGIDENCNGQIDEGTKTYYEDNDGDGFGNFWSSITQACSLTPPSGYVTIYGDCNDNNANVNFSATEVCNGIDDNCDGIIDEVGTQYFADLDGDGYGDLGAFTYSCFGTPLGYVANSTDCNDADSAIHPGAIDLCNNNIDEDCNGLIDDQTPTYYADADNDGFGDPATFTATCNPTLGYVLNNFDCDDNNNGINPSAIEICANSIDENCDGLIDQLKYFHDFDYDGFGNPNAFSFTCNPGPGYSLDSTDCDDGNPFTHPGATEFCNGIDDNCNGLIDDNVIDAFQYAWLDSDGDGQGYFLNYITVSCNNGTFTPPAGYVFNNNDCNDSLAYVYLGAVEICSNGIDDNCNGQIDENCCIASTAPATVTTDAAYNNICLGNSITLTANGGTLGSNATYKWYKGSCGGVLVGTGVNITLSPTSTDVYFVRAEGCDTTACASVTITVSTSPVTSNAIVPFTGMPNIVCNGTTATLSIPLVSRATFYVWDAPTGSYFSGNVLNVSPFTTTTPSVTVTFGNPSGSLYNVGVQAGNACGSSIRQSQRVRGLTSVPTSISGSLTACLSSVGTYTTSAVTGATSYLWTITGNATVSGTGTTATVTFGPSWTGGTLCVSAQTTCYTSAAKCIPISKNAAALGAISGTFTACPNTTITYSVPASAGAASYMWTLPTGSSGSSTTNSIAATFGSGYNAVGSICVSATSICGVTSAPKCKTVAPGLPSQPSSISGPTNGLCGQSVVYSCPSQGVGVTYNWTVPAGANVVSGQGSTSINVQYGTFTTGNVCVTASNSCGSSIARCITVKGAPASPLAITATPSSWCANTQGIEFNANVSNVTGNYTLSWAFPTLPIATYVFGGGNSTSLLMDWLTGTGNINVTASNACGSGTRTSTWSQSCRQGEVGTVSTLIVSPNPTTGVVNINYTASKGNTTINVLDLAGRVIMARTVSSIDGANNTQLDMSKLAKGAYMLSVQSTQGNKQVKVVVE